MARIIPYLLPGLFILLVLLTAGCTGTMPGENQTVTTAPSPAAIPTTLPATAVAANTTIPSLVTTVTPVAPATATTVTLTTRPIPPPTLSSINVYGINYQVFALSRDTQGVITTGNITLSGVIDSLSAYPLKVVVRGDMFGAHSPFDQPKATAYDTVYLTPHGTAGFVLHMDNYVFNDWPGYAVEPDTWNLTVENVSVATG
ncbi:hypothetical protein [Methanoregula sp.]|uniref:hypothetical protein n=1 Tax=Methanoregula sp. TaxID=2052170 RepID=UPI002CBC753C|nr:hypothetical protein [Methanoregula sp.]HVP96374.1 hypothetical protein [Methanoregula sp.]